MPSLIHLRRKIRSITNTKQITKAMQMVAASKMRRAQEAALGTRAYANTGQVIMARIQQSLDGVGEELTHPLLAIRPVKRIALVAIASDRTLAGAYNSNIIRRTLQFLREHNDQEVKVITVGRKVEESLARAGVNIELSFTNFPDRPTSKDIGPIAKVTVDAFLANEIDQVSVIFTRFQSTLKQTVEEQQILPIQPIDADKNVAITPAVFEPNPNEVLNFILPRLIETQFLQAILDSLASEHSSRMLAMKSATDNANELIDDLRMTYNGVRQANITSEIAEISAGSANH